MGKHTRRFEAGDAIVDNASGELGVVTHVMAEGDSPSGRVIRLHLESSDKDVWRSADEIELYEISEDPQI